MLPKARGSKRARRLLDAYPHVLRRARVRPQGKRIDNRKEENRIDKPSKEPEEKGRRGRSPAPDESLVLPGAPTPANVVSLLPPTT